jgi:hypothetical protein
VELEVIAEGEVAVVSALADFSPLLLHEAMKKIDPAEAIIKNFFIGFLIFYLKNELPGVTMVEGNCI